MYVFLKLADILLWPLLVSGILIIIIAIVKGVRVFRLKDPQNVKLVGIWLLGLISFVFGLLGQLFALAEGFDKIEITGDISASLVFHALRVSIQYSALGLTFLVVSLIITAILRMMIFYRRKKLFPEEKYIKSL